MLPLIPLIMMGMSVLKSKQDQEKANQDRYVQAETTRMSPWTRMHANAPEQVNYVGNALGGLASGAAQQQNMAKNQKSNDYMDAETRLLNAGTKEHGGSVPDMSAAASAAPSIWSQMSGMFGGG